MLATRFASADVTEWKRTETLVLGDYFAIGIENPDGKVHLIS